MVRLWIALVVIVLALVVAGVNLLQQRRAPAGAEPSYPIFHLAALTLAFVLAMLPLDPASLPYKGIVGFALLVLIVRDALAWIPGTPRAIVAGSSVVLWFLLWLGVSVIVGRAVWSLTGLLVLAPFLLLAWPAWRMRRTVGDLWLTLVVYAVQLALAIGFALVLVVQQPGAWSFCALLATLVLAATDLLLLRGLLRPPAGSVALWRQTLTAAGALLLALSAWGPSQAQIPALFGM